MCCGLFDISDESMLKFCMCTCVLRSLQGICDLAGAKLGKLQSSLVAAARAQGGMLQDMRGQVRQYRARAAESDSRQSTEHSVADAKCRSIFMHQSGFPGDVEDLPVTWP